VESSLLLCCQHWDFAASLGSRDFALLLAGVRCVFANSWHLQGKTSDPFISSGGCGPGNALQIISLFGQLVSMAFFFFSTQHISALFVKSPPVYCLCDSAGTTDLKCSHDSDLLCGMTRGKQQEETWGLKITAVSSREATETAKGCFIPLPLIRALPHQQALT